MDGKFSKHVMGIPIGTTRALLLSKPYQPHYLLSTSSKTNCSERKDHFAVTTKNHVRLGSKLVEIVKHKLINGAKIFKLSSPDKIFTKNFSIRVGEMLLQALQCYLYTTAGEIAGLLFVSTERVAFCSDRSLKMYSTTGELLKFQYKVSIPLGKIKGVGESMNTMRPSKKYVELATVDDFKFWFMGFINYKQTLRHLHRTISVNSLRN